MSHESHRSASGRPPVVTLDERRRTARQGSSRHSSKNAPVLRLGRRVCWRVLRALACEVKNHAPFRTARTGERGGGRGPGGGSNVAPKLAVLDRPPPREVAPWFAAQLALEA